MLQRFGLTGLVLLLGVWASTALAAGDVFTVRGVEVDATASGAAEARDIALGEGQREAFKRLMHRLTRQQDWAFLPEVSASSLADLVRGVEVAEERASSTRYIARVTYAFKPVATRRLLRQSGVPFSEARAKTYLLLAVLESPDQIIIWEDPNPWREAWAERELIDELVPILVPLNDIEDSEYVTASQALSADWDQVSDLAAKYGLENVLIAHAQVDGPLGEGNLKVNLSRLSHSRESETQFNFAGGGDPQIQMEKAVDAALNRLYEEWKAATIVMFGQESVLTATVWFDSLEDWMIIRRRLEQAPTVTSMDILGFSPNGAEIRLRYVGTEGQLKITLEQSSVLISNAAGFWEIAMAERGLRTMPEGAAEPGVNATTESMPGPVTPVSESGAEPGSETEYDFDIQSLPKPAGGG